MDVYYSKSKPKVVSYNPLTHMSFYNQSSSPAPNSRGSFDRQSPPFSQLNSPSSYPKPISLVAKNIFATPSYNRKSPSSPDISTDDSQRYYKTRARNKVTDPISGEVKIFSIQRPRIESFDTSYNRDKLTNDFDYESILKFSDNKQKLKSNDNIAGSLKKEVPFVPYVNPYLLKNSINT